MSQNNIKRKQENQQTDAPPEKLAKEEIELQIDKKMKRKKSKSKKKRENASTNGSAGNNTISTVSNGGATASLYIPTTCPSSGEAMEVEQIKESRPKLIIDLTQLFSVSGSRPSGSHLHCIDIKNLMIHTVLGSGRWDRPTWCSVKEWNNVKHTLFIMVGYVSGEDYIVYKECFRNIDKHFTQGYPVRNDGSEGLFVSPLETYLNYKMKKKAAREKQKNNNGKGLLPIELTLTKDERIVNEYPFAECQMDKVPEGYVSTRRTENGKETNNEEEELDTNDHRMFAIDCEMCDTCNGRALTRISIVNEDLAVVYDTFVKPDEPITNYLTQYSGITAEILSDVRTNLVDVQQQVLELISEDDILVGHSLENDLNCLKIIHDRFIDTSVIFGDQRGARFKPSLRHLVKEHLKREIQNNEAGHCSIEDAKACMELVQLKLERGKHYGLIDKPNESIFELFSRANKTSVVVDTPLIARQHCFRKTHSVVCSSDEEVVKGTKSYAGRASMIFSHLKGYENLIRDCDRKHIRAENERVKETMKQLDGNIDEMIEAMGKNTLVVVLFSSGYLPPHIQSLQRDKEKRKSEEVKMAVKKARDCICFMKVTE